MQTFRKLPMQAPTVNTSAKSGQSAAAAAGSSMWAEKAWLNGLSCVAGVVKCGA